MIHRGIVTLSAALMICFLMLSYFDSQFYLIHFYESLIYLAIIVMLFFFEDRWAYMFGMVMPAIWLVLTFAMGFISGMFRQISLLAHLQGPDSAADLIGAGIALLSLLLILFCGYRWRREFVGLKHGARTMAISLGVAAVYYGIVVVWILRWPPGAD